MTTKTKEEVLKEGLEMFEQIRKEDIENRRKRKKERQIKKKLLRKEKIRNYGYNCNS